MITNSISRLALTQIFLDRTRMDEITTTYMVKAPSDYGVQRLSSVFTSSACSGYRYGFNGMEKDDEVKGRGNSYDFRARLYDSRLGIWLSRDPHESKYVFLSPYNAFASNPIRFKDPNGKDIIDFIKVVQKYSAYAFRAITNSKEFNKFLSQWSNAEGDSKSLGYMEKGKFSEIKLSFHTYNEDLPEAGNSKIYYDGVELSKLDKVPSQMELSKVSIVVGFNINETEKKKETSIDEFDVGRTITVIH